MRRLGLIALFILCLFLISCGKKEETWQGIYYPTGLTHGDGEQVYGPIFTNYKACEERGLYELSEELRDSMCISECNGTIAGLPQCEKVIRSRAPFPTSEVYLGAVDIRKKILDSIEQANEKLRLQEEENKRRIEAEKQAELERQAEIQRQAEAAHKKMCDELKSDANKEIADIKKNKSNYFCNNLNNEYARITELENKIKNVNNEAKSKYSGNVPSNIINATANNLKIKYQEEIDSLYRRISNFSINECKEEEMNNRKFDELILQRQQLVVNKGC